MADIHGRLTQIWHRSTRLAEVSSADRSAILRLADLAEPPLILEGTAAFIWQLTAEPVTTEVVVDAFCAQFEVEPGDVDGIVAGFLNDLMVTGLLDRNASAALMVSGLGVPVAIEISGAEGGELYEKLVAAWSWCLLSTDTAAAATVVVPALDDLGDLGSRLEWVTQQVTLRAIEARAGRDLLLHACVVADPATGAAVVLVGPSGMGKTTLAAFLGRRWAYVTDETAAIGADGTITAYPKPLSVIEDPDLPKVQRSPGELGLNEPPADLHLAGIVLLDRRSQDASLGSGLQVDTVPTVDAVAMLAEHTSYLAALDKPMAWLGTLLSSTGGLRVATYGASEDLVPLIDELLASPDGSAR